ncbi:uncharacterized protein LOC119097140 [Pollicipes pollicipes]|uniref:uncharacterized protein LOC119097140 n=1 Tax=Pollicipes pollicipes TaxID=41117 RepID=UPI001884AF7D|nr:uncharacterized protein LOC119097140 [Pollicipes pollicipes]
MWRCELLVFCALLLSGAARTASAQADPTDCGATRSLLLAKGVPESVLSETTATGAAAGELCAANSSCCSLPWEHGIRHVVQDEFRKMLLENTEHLKRLLQEQAIAVQGESNVHSVKQVTDGLNRRSQDTLAAEENDGDCSQ